MGLMKKLKRMAGMKHPDAAEEEQSYDCPKCGESFDTPKAKMEHAKEAHGTGKKAKAKDAERDAGAEAKKKAKKKRDEKGEKPSGSKKDKKDDKDE